MQRAGEIYNRLIMYLSLLWHFLFYKYVPGTFQKVTAKQISIKYKIS